jgi:quercetin dioxygenase-like cupin family protein
MTAARSFALAALAPFALALAGCAASGPAHTPPTNLSMRDLLTQQLADEFTPGREVIVSYVEAPPNTELERHWHPGEEFHYYLEGDVTIEIDGAEPIIGVPGTVGHVPYRRLHTAISGPTGARLLVFRVHAAGEPVRYLESGAEPGR